MYAGWAVNDRVELLAALADQGVAPAHPAVIAEHVTHAYPSDEAAPPLAKVVVIGHVWDDRVQALVVHVAGAVTRPDGRIYHITLSVAPGAEPVESNRLVAEALEGRAGWADLHPIHVPVTPFLREVEG